MYFFLISGKLDCKWTNRIALSTELQNGKYQVESFIITDLIKLGYKVMLHGGYVKPTS